MQHNKNLAITADDYGPHPQINQGILEAIKNNKITSVGVLTNTYKSNTDPSYLYNFKKEIYQLIECIESRSDVQKTQTKIGIGVHLTLTSGIPLTDNKKLLPSKPNLNRFQAINEMRLIDTPSHLKAVKEELKAQIVRLKLILDEHKADISIDHISCHHGITFLYGPYHNQLLKAIEEIYPLDKYSTDDRPVLRSAIPISKHKPWKKHFKGSLMKKEGTKRAFRLIDDNLDRIFGIALGAIRFKNLKKRNSKANRQNIRVFNYLFENLYKKPNQSEFYRVFKKYPKRAYSKTAGEIVLHLAKVEEDVKQFNLHGINERYILGRAKELDELLKFDLFDSAAKKGIRIGTFRGVWTDL